MTMDITPANTHQGTGAGRGIVKMDGTGKLSNKIALITGGTTGIGAATATRFQAEGARVIVTGSNPATLQVADEGMPRPDRSLIYGVSMRAMSPSIRKVLDRRT